MARPTQIFLTIAAGILAGVVGSFLMGARSARPNTTTPAAEPAHLSTGTAGARPVIVMTPAGSAASEKDIAELRDRLATLEASASARPQADARPPRHETAEEHTQRLLSEHASEGVDPTWSLDTARSLESDFGHIDSTHFDVIGVDCRTTSCVARMRWRSYADATQDFGAIAHHPFAANCARSISLPQPSDPSASYEAPVIFDCTGFRAEQASGGAP